MDLMDQNFATKADFKEHYFMTKNDLKDVQNEMKEMRTEFKVDMKDLEHRLTVRLGVMLAASIGIISALITFKH
jgi:hypothetical protein